MQSSDSPKKRTVLFWFGRILLVSLAIAIIWVVNLIWFKPFNISLFYDKVFLEFVIDDPETVTQIGVPVLYDLTKDELSDASDAKNWEDFEKLKSNYETLLSYDFESQSPENQLNTKILSWFLGIQVEGDLFF